VEASTAGLIADLEAGLAAARQLAAEDAPTPTGAAGTAASTEPDASSTDTSAASAPEDPAMMPGGAAANTPASDATETAPLLQKVERDAEGDAVDIIGELKAGSSISDIANKLLDQDGLSSIVKAIGDLAGKIGL
jgi:hypothetical protein